MGYQRKVLSALQIGAYLKHHTLYHWERPSQITPQLLHYHSLLLMLSEYRATTLFFPDNSCYPVSSLVSTIMETPGEDVGVCKAPTNKPFYWRWSHLNCLKWLSLVLEIFLLLMIFAHSNYPQNTYWSCGMLCLIQLSETLFLGGLGWVHQRVIIEVAGPRKILSGTQLKLNG